jgi:hypothetical protein
METIIFAKTIKGYRKRNGGRDMKAYTDLSQSEKLAEILPIETADMRYVPFGDSHPWVWNEEVKLLEKDSVPCWSLAALIDVLPNENMLVKATDGEHYCLAKDVMTKHYDNPVDACYEVIVKLKKKNLL